MGIVFFELHRIASDAFKIELIVFIVYYIQLKCKVKCKKKKMYIIYLFWSFKRFLLFREVVAATLSLVNLCILLLYIFYIITLYLNSNFTKFIYAYGYMFLSLLKNKGFFPKQVICRFLSPLSIIWYVSLKKNQTPFVMRAMLYMTVINFLLFKTQCVNEVIQVYKWQTERICNFI